MINSYIYPLNICVCCTFLYACYMQRPYHRPEFDDRNKSFLHLNALVQLHSLRCQCSVESKRQFKLIYEIIPLDLTFNL